MQLLGQLLELARRFTLSAQLNQVHSAIDHFPSNSRRVVRNDVGKVEDPVKPGFSERAQG
jgi:hypothetical protein